MSPVCSGQQDPGLSRQSVRGKLEGARVRPLVPRVLLPEPVWWFWFLVSLCSFHHISAPFDLPRCLPDPFSFSPPMPTLDAGTPFGDHPHPLYRPPFSHDHSLTRQTASAATSVARSVRSTKSTPGPAATSGTASAARAAPSSSSTRRSRCGTARRSSRATSARRTCACRCRHVEDRFDGGRVGVPLAWCWRQDK